MSRQMTVREDRTQSRFQIEFRDSLVRQCEALGASYDVGLRGTANLLGVKRDDLRFIYTEPESVAIIARWKLVKILKALPRSARGDLFFQLSMFRPANDGNAYKHRKKFNKRQLREHRRFKCHF